MTAAVQVLPNCLEAEHALLGTIFSVPRAIDACAGLRPEDFFEPLHGRMYAYAQEQVKSTGRVMPAALISHFRADQTIETLGQPCSNYVAGLIGVSQPVGAVPYLTTLIKNDAALRLIHSQAEKLVEQSLRPEIGQTAQKLAQDAIAALASIQSAVSTEKRSVGISDASASIIEKINDVNQTGEIEGFAYAGCGDLENVIGGWKPGKYYVIGARPSMGKSTFGLSMMRRCAEKGHGVLFVSLEMTSDELARMALADSALEQGTRIEYRDLEPDRIVGDRAGAAKKIEAAITAKSKLDSSPLWITDRAGQTVNDIRLAAMKHDEILRKRGKRLEVILIDHMGLIKPDDRYKGFKTQEVEAVSNELKVLAKELGVAVMALCQLNRGVENREDKMPGLQDLRQSGAIEQDADVVMFLYRKAYYLERKREEDVDDEAARLIDLENSKNDLEVLFAKHRGGPCPLVKLWVDVATGSVRDAQK